MKSILVFLTLIFINMSLSAQLSTPFENDNDYSASYHETIEFFKTLSAKSKFLSLSEFGETDAGFPLHELVISGDGSFNRSEDKTILFINNAIHPGEPCGVDATMILVRDICEKKELQKLLEHIQIVIIPFYNIGGGLNRGSHSRANQLGPKEYGFRGNAKNLDLNRDFIKCDSKNAKSFNLLFNKWDPHVMIDNHTSNGADYQYVMTLIATQKDKLEKGISNYMVDRMLPDLYKKMESKAYEMTPYVFSYSIPDEGIYGFLDLPRYSSGYAALHNTISFMPETHMLKPYKDRVYSTYHFMMSMVEFLDSENGRIISIKTEASHRQRKAKNVDINWRVDMDKVEKLNFKGYEAKKRPSDISGIDRLFYDKEAKYEKEVRFFNSYLPTVSVVVPEAYIMPQAYSEVIDRMHWNDVIVEALQEDTELQVEMYYIDDYETSDSPYEGHYMHSEVKLKTVVRKENFFKGDLIITTDQEKINYLISVLEPHAPDSYFVWNFFDGILMQKEYFSDYVFEDLALKILESNPKLQEKLAREKKEDKDFAGDARAQLNFIYQHSAYYEKTHNRYPVARILKMTNDH